MWAYGAVSFLADEHTARLRGEAERSRLAAVARAAEPRRHTGPLARWVHRPSSVADRTQRPVMPAPCQPAVG